MRSFGWYRKIAAALGVLLVGAWAAALLDLEWGSSSVGDVRVVLPVAAYLSEKRPGGNLSLSAAGARGCNTRQGGTSEVSAYGRFTRQVSLHEAEVGQRLVWLGFDCKDGSTRFARAVEVSSPAVSSMWDPMVAVAQVRLDFRLAKVWLEEFLTELIRSYAAMHFGYEVGKPKFDLTVSDGFEMDIALPMNIRPEAEAGWATVHLKLKLVAVEGRRFSGQPINLVLHTQKYSVDTGSWVVNAIFHWAVISTKVSGSMMNVQRDLERQANHLFGKLLTWFADEAAQEFLGFLINHSSTIKRIAASGDLPEKLGVEDLKVDGSGETLHFSLTVPKDWLGIEIPELVATETGKSISASVSYAFINRLLGLILDDRKLDDVLKELKGDLVRSGVISAATFDEGKRTVSSLGNTLEEFLAFAELIYDETLSFELPVRLRPVSAAEMRVFFANAEVLKINPAPTYVDWACAPTQRDVGECTPSERGAEESAPPQDLPATPVGISAEGRVVFDRVPNNQDARFLLDHIAFEPMPHWQVREVDYQRYYALTPLFRRLVLWEEAGDLDGEPLGKGLMQFREHILSIIRAVSMWEQAPVEFELYADDYGVTVGSLDIARNDVRRNALILGGTLAYSKAGAVYATKDETAFRIKTDKTNGREADDAARLACNSYRVRFGSKPNDGKTCLNRMVFYRAFVAVAMSEEKKYYFGKGPHRGRARALAIHRCQRAGGLGCRVKKGYMWRNEV